MERILLKGVDFSDKLYDGPYDNILQKKTDALGNGEFLNNRDIPSTDKSKIFTHLLSPQKLAKMRLKDIESDFKNKLGKESLEEINKYILDLKDEPLKEIDELLKKQGDIQQDYILLEDLPDNLKETICNIRGAAL